MKRFLTMAFGGLGTAAMAVASMAAPAHPATAKEPLRGPGAVVWCSDVEPTWWEDTSQPGPGFVIFGEDAAGRLHANIALKEAAPGHTYVVRVIQATPDGRDCYTVDGHITTNNRGNGELKVVEPKLADATAVQVIIDTSTVFNTPTFRGTDLYPLSLARPSGASRTAGPPAATSADRCGRRGRGRRPAPRGGA